MTTLKEMAEAYGLSADQSWLKIEVARRAYLAGAKSALEMAIPAITKEKINGSEIYGMGLDAAVVIVRNLIQE